MVAGLTWYMDIDSYLVLKDLSVALGSDSGNKSVQNIWNNMLKCLL